MASDRTKRPGVRSGLCVAGAAALLGMGCTSAHAGGGPGAAERAAAAPAAVAGGLRSGDTTLGARADALLNRIRERLADCSGDGRSLASSAMQRSSDAPAAASARPALRWSPQLAAAASRHAGAMARTRLFDHVGIDGTTVRERVTATGYRWQSIGENLAAGHVALEDAVAGWLESRSHCEALIDPRFTEFGIAQTVSDRPDDTYGTYWTLVLGRPR
jgi:hypothetical protein